MSHNLIQTVREIRPSPLEGATHITFQITQSATYLKVERSLTFSLFYKHAVHCDRGDQKSGKLFSFTVLERQMSEKREQKQTARNASSRAELSLYSK